MKRVRNERMLNQASRVTDDDVLIKLYKSFNFTYIYLKFLRVTPYFF